MNTARTLPEECTTSATGPGRTAEIAVTTGHRCGVVDHVHLTGRPFPGLPRRAQEASVLPETTYQLICFDHAERVARAAVLRRARSVPARSQGGGRPGRSTGRPPSVRSR